MEECLTFRVIKEDLRSVGARHQKLVILDAKLLEAPLRICQTCHSKSCKAGSSQELWKSLGQPMCSRSAHMIPTDILINNCMNWDNAWPAN